MNIYGLIVALATLAGLFCARNLSKSINLSYKIFEELVIVILISGIVGARLWHVITDFSLYKQNLLATLAIWNGGLSIIGAVLLGFITIILYYRVRFSFFVKKDINLYHLLDIGVISVSLSQSIGRWANFFNHELFGLPTKLPWKIYIEKQYRPLRFKQFNYFHPLFLYESLILLFLFVLFCYLLKTKKIKLGTGLFFYIYLLVYSFSRFILDFLRIYKSDYFLFGLGINQVLLIIVFVIAIYMLFNSFKRLIKK